MRRPTLTRLSLVLTTLVMLLAACAGGAATPTEPSDVLPTGLVGPVAPTTGPTALRYVALGDSFTFGDGVRQTDRWPNQLVRLLRPALDVDLTANLAGRSTKSAAVITDQLPSLLALDPQLVSLQVGVNDVVLLTSTPQEYRDNIGVILDTVLTIVPADRVFVVTTPDYTLTPFGPEQDDDGGDSARIREINVILGEVAAARGIAVVDISPIADRVPVDPTLVATDQLHPSGKQYAGWADLAAETVRAMFQEPDPSP